MGEGKDGKPILKSENGVSICLPLFLYCEMGGLRGVFPGFVLFKDINKGIFSLIVILGEKDRQLNAYGEVLCGFRGSFGHFATFIGTQDAFADTVTDGRHF
jgi:hypothetical protein